MPVHLLPRQRRQLRPERYRLRDSHDLANRLAWYLPEVLPTAAPSQRGSVLGDWRGPKTMSIVNSGAHTSRVLGPLGPAAKYPKSGGQRYHSVGYTNAIGTGDFTLAMHMRDTNSTGSFDSIGGFGSFSPGFYERVSTKWGFYSGGNIEANTAITMSSNDWWTLVAVRRAGTVYFYINGLPDGSAAMAGAVASSAFTLGWEGFGVSGVAVTWAALWERALSPGEARSLHDDPWQLLEPTPARTYFTAAAEAPPETPGTLPGYLRELYVGQAA